MSEAGRRLKAARIARGFKTAAAAAEAFGWNRNTYSSNENGNAPFSFRRAKEYAAAFGVDALMLYEGQVVDVAGAQTAPLALNPVGVFVPIVGDVGALPAGLLRFYEGDEVGELVPLPPGGTERSVAIRSAGSGLQDYAPPGSILYFEDARSSIGAAALAAPVFVGEARGGVRLGFLLKGSSAGQYDLSCAGGEMLRNRKFAWAEHVTAIIPPYQAARLVRRG